MASSFDERLSCGFYEDLVHQMHTMDSTLAGSDYPRDFRQSSTYGDGCRFVTCEGRPFFANVIGELCAAKKGTQFDATGNHFVGNNPDKVSLIDDKSRIKFVFVLKSPTNAPDSLADLYHNQVVTLNQIREGDSCAERKAGQEYFVKEWTRRDEDDENLPDLIAVTTDQIYKVPATFAKTEQRQLTKRKIGDSANKETAVPESNGEAADIKEDVRLGALYDPRKLEDYGGDLFNHRLAKLTQLDIRDADNNLIPPWEYYDALRPGTLVLACVSLHCFVMPVGDGKKKKIYQINAEKIRVLAPSTLPKEIRSTPEPKSPGQNGRSASESSLTQNVEDDFKHIQAFKKVKPDNTKPDNNKADRAGGGERKQTKVKKGGLNGKADIKGDMDLTV